MSLSLHFLFIFLGITLIFLLFPIIRQVIFNLQMAKDKDSTPAILSDKLITYEEDNSYYVMAFELYTGQKKVFKVNQFDFSKHNKGDKGILTYSGSTFIYFKKKY